MCERVIIEQCSPTLAGIKTANLFSCKCDDKNKLLNDIRNYNRNLSSKGVLMIPIKIDSSKALIYLYRPSKLEKDLTDKTALNLLKEHGYSDCNPNKCICRLINRFKNYEQFPHEVGLFLGYPPEDVKGFIENNAKCSKCVGCWKVYGDEEKAKKCFENYKKCTRIYKELYLKGKTIERLTVAV